MSDAIDADLANRMRATRHLMKRAQVLEAKARDESLEDEVRVLAALDARAIRSEMKP